jgi:hypothetical protein
MGARWSESFPVSGMTHNGNLYPLQALVPRTLDGDGGAWHIPSPTVSDLYTGNLTSTQQSEDTNHSVTLPQWAERYPTPQAADGSDVETGFGLRDYVNHKRKYMLPTPTKNVNADCPSERNRHTPALESAVNIEDQTKGKLSASWVEWLMGLPEGWVSKEPLAPGNKAKWDELASLAMWWDEERGLPRVVEDQVDRVPRLKTLGNGIVPMCIPIFLGVHQPQA